MKIKYILTLFISILLAGSAFCQHQMYFEDFEAATNTFTLNDTAKALGNNKGNNKWIVNNIYKAGGIYPSTISEDSTYGGTISFHPYSHYLHIYDSASGYVDDNYNTTDSSTRFVHMTSGICTKSMTDINFNFFYLCQGSSTAYGQVYYSIDGGPWTQTGSALYNNRYKWQYATITDPAFSNVADLRFGFLWHNNSTAGKDTSAFGIDDVSMYGIYDSVSHPITCSFTTLGADSCLGGSEYVFFEANLGDSTCDAIWNVYMSKGNGTFPGSYAWYGNVGPDYSNDITSYWYLLPPASFQTVGGCYKFKFERTSYPYLTFIDSVCFPFDSCPGTITTLQPPATLDTNAICAGSVMDVPFFSSGLYDTYNTYYAELIDTIAGKAKIDTIGALPSNVAYPYPPGDVVSTIPLTVPSGCNYYVRIISSTPNRKPSLWGPFCIQHCDIITNNQQSVSACLGSCKKQPKGFSDSIVYNVHQFDSLEHYVKGNKFEVQLIQFQLYPPSYGAINKGLLGAVVDTAKGKIYLHVPCPDTLFANGINPGVYYLRIVADSSNFSDSAFGSLVQLTIGEPADSMYLTVSPSTGPYCSGSTVTFYTNPDDQYAPYNSTYTWWVTDKRGGTQMFNGWDQGYLGYNSVADTFLILCQENNYGCAGNKTKLNDTIIVLGAPSVVKTGAAQVCARDTNVYSIPFSNNATYSWKIYTKYAHSDTANNSLKIVFDTTGTFKVSVVAFNPCFTDSATWTIKVINPPAGKITTIPSTNVCPGESVSLTASGGTKYVWNSGAKTASVTLSPKSDTTCWVKISNAACTITDTTKLTIAATPTVTVIPNSPLICRGDTVTLMAKGAITYSWVPNIDIYPDTGSIVRAAPASSITYMVKGANSSGCTDSVNVNVSVDVVASTITSAVSIIDGQSVDLNVTGGGTYQWTPASALSCSTCPNPIATPTVTTIYTVAVTDSNHCTTFDTVTVEVEPECGKIFVPDAFSPNGDGQNDVLYVRNNCIKTFDFIVFDRWGNKVFESTNPAIGWDGNYNGKPMNTGSYVYYVSVLTIDNKEISAKGNVTLVR